MCNLAMIREIVSDMRLQFLVVMIMSRKRVTLSSHMLWSSLDLHATFGVGVTKYRPVVMFWHIDTRGHHNGRLTYLISQKC